MKQSNADILSHQLAEKLDELANGASCFDVARDLKALLENLLRNGDTFLLRKELKELLELGTPRIYYKDRNDSRITAVQFLDEEYGRFLRAGILYKNQLRNLDEKLVIALNKKKTREEMQLCGLTLPVISERTRRIGEEVSGLVGGMYKQSTVVHAMRKHK